MIRTTNALAARKNFGQLLEEAYYRGDQIIVERAGKPMAVIVSIEEFENWQTEREQDFTFLDKIRERTKDIDAEKIEAIIDEAVKAVRKRKK